ncbi:GFA family protein [Hoeflea sp. CAU 1731]
MTTIFEGGCACGAIRYVAKGEPVAQSHCQCRHCQMRSGGGHGSYLVFAGDDAVTVTGKPKTWRIAGDSGNEKIHAFCPDCGAPVCLTFAAMPGVTAIHAGSLDEPARFRPTAVTYTASGPGWDTLDSSLAAFAGMPPG